MSISSTLVHGAEIRFREAAEPLRPFVGCFWVVSAEAGATIRVVPDGSAAISIPLQECPSSEWILRGPLIRPDERRFEVETTLVGIRLRAGAAFLVSGIPAHTTVGRRVDLRGIAAFRELVAADPHPRTPDRCVDVLERFLLRRLEHVGVHNVIASALDAIDRAHGSVGVADVADRCGVSVRHLHRLMRTWVGYGPKRYATIIRFQATLHEMEDVPGRTGADLAAGHGYFDQAHLALDVARFAGATPAHLVSSGVADFSKTRCDDLP
jgi:AraC-like DNA-binding protein